MVVLAQEAKPAATSLPPVVVEQTAVPKKPKTAEKTKAKTGPQQAVGTPGQPVAAAAPAQGSGTTVRSGSLSVPNTAEARAILNQIPGGVEVVPDSQFKNGPANTVKDVLGSVPGVIIQTRWGPDGRLSIRGSGLTRNYGNRGINAFMDGIPINTSDGLFDLFEIDPTAYRYVEVFKGANALRYGSNALGGAINFVTPTGYNADAFGVRVDVGSFGYLKSAVSSGGVSGPVDYFINMSAQREDGYRDHSDNRMERLSANLGYRLSEDAETRFYVNANTWRGRLPGEVTKDAALNSPRTAAADWVRQDQQRNIDSLRVANKTTLRIDDTLVELGLFGVDRHVMHPIYRWLDYKVRDYGAFARATDERWIGGFRNRLILGGHFLNGVMDYNEFQNLDGAVKGPMTASTVDRSENYSAYAENSFYFLKDVALVAGTQYTHAVRDRRDRFFDDSLVPFSFDTQPDDSGRRTFDLWSPKAGVLWDVDRTWQIFANVSRSGEVPTYDTTSYSSPPSPNLKAQTGTTYEIGTRGSRPDFNWDVSLYRAELRNELQCLTTYMVGTCGIVNADRTVHQGVEAGVGVAFAKSVFAREDRFWLNLTYTYNDFFFDGDAKWGNNQLPGVPPHYLRAEVLYRSADGFYAGPNVEWMPQSFYADNANTLTVDPYALLNFKLGYERTKGWSGYVEGRNLLDERYISTTMASETAAADSPLFNPGTGRAIYSGVQYKW
jgi:iron complex outermembrane receptor protein